VLLKQAQALDPKNQRDLLLVNMAWVQFMLGDYDSAITYAHRFQEINPTYMPGDPTAAAAYASKGDREHANAAMEAALKADPTMSISASIRVIEDPASHIHPAYKSWFLQSYVPALRLAGFPE
jgi:tetratricopeptide (TPR) repeat protein